MARITAKIVPMPCFSRKRNAEIALAPMSDIDELRIENVDADISARITICTSDEKFASAVFETIRNTWNGLYA